MRRWPLRKETKINHEFVKKNESTVRFLLRYSKYVIPILTILSLFKLVLFYRYFEIPIEDYLSFEEFLTPFIGDLFSYVSGIGGGFLIGFIILNLNLPNKNLRFTENKIAYGGLYLLTAMIFGIGIIITITIVLNIDFISKVIMIAWIISVMALPIIIGRVFWKVDRKTYFITMGLGFMFIGIVAKSAVVANEIKKGIVFDEVTIELENDKVIYCKDSLFYIGKVKNFTFLYRITDDARIIIDNKEIRKTILIKRKLKGYFNF